MKTYKELGGECPWAHGPPKGMKTFGFGGVMAAIGARILGLSLAFQDQFLALAPPCHARFGAANASERPLRYGQAGAPPNGMIAGGTSCSSQLLRAGGSVKFRAALFPELD